MRRLRAPDGRARVQTFPRHNLVDHAAFERFVDGVRGVDPNATGVAVNLVEFARTTREAFQQALATAVVVITAILWLLWRRVGDVLLVLIPLFLGAVLTGAVMVLLDVPLNFFNVVVIPLIMGAGVDSGIHLVDQSRAGAPGRPRRRSVHKERDEADRRLRLALPAASRPPGRDQSPPRMGPVGIIAAFFLEGLSTSLRESPAAGSIRSGFLASAGRSGRRRW